MSAKVNVNDLVLVQGMKDTKLTLSRWNKAPLSAVGPWALLSFAIALSLLASVYGVAKLSSPDGTKYIVPGLTGPAGFGDYVHIEIRNGLVLALHALACVAGFMAGSALPLSASNRTGVSRWVHEKAGPLAIAFVVGATAFSLCTQAYVLGGTSASLAQQLHTTPGIMLVGLLPHAILELTALFLPLAAWTIASRRGNWHELLAATFVTTAIAIPVLVLCGVIELFVSPELTRALIF
jgi:Stage II sporulation protein M